MPDTPLPPATYRGRFAPSPTGELHFGSLVAAVASYADARHHQGTWLVRIEDVDRVRTCPGAETQILEALTAFGMHWDETPTRQSTCGAAYDAAIEKLKNAQRAFRCRCSRRAVADAGLRGLDGPVYPGTCRRKPPPEGSHAAWRVVVGDAEIAFSDRIAGPIRQALAKDVGDFVIRRRDGFTAYQLAVVVDDARQGITQIVRGADLLWSTPRQVFLQGLLDFRTPTYAHVPLVYGADGRKLSKRDAAHPIDTRDPMPALTAAWRHLGQRQLPASLRTIKDFWRFAAETWDLSRIAADNTAPR